jgi:16S rRNA (uracil1498-N3)-methyltransferase
VNLFYQPGISEGIHYLDQEESRHCAKVLRKRPGDTIHITDGKGSLYTATLTEARPDKCSFSIASTEKEKTRSFYIHMAIAPTKNPDRTEWFVEKAIEIGVDEISFLLCDNSERAALKTDRLEKLAVSAMKQSLRYTIAKINHMVLMKDFVKETKASSKFIAYVDNTNPDHLQKQATPNTTCVVLIGPEGDFSKKELDLAIEQGYKKVSLGPNRLRTETAGLAACHILNLINEK